MTVESNINVHSKDAVLILHICITSDPLEVRDGAETGTGETERERKRDTN